MVKHGIPSFASCSVKSVLAKISKSKPKKGASAKGTVFKGSGAGKGQQQRHATRAPVAVREQANNKTDNTDCQTHLGILMKFVDVLVFVLGQDILSQLLSHSLNTSTFELSSHYSLVLSLVTGEIDSIEKDDLHDGLDRASSSRSFSMCHTLRGSHRIFRYHDSGVCHAGHCQQIQQQPQTEHQGGLFISSRLE